jgi:hypothetical protein
MLSCLIETTLRASSPKDAMEKLAHLASLSDVPPAYLEQLREGATSSVALSAKESLSELNKLLISSRLKPVSPEQPQETFDDDDIPF